MAAAMSFRSSFVLIVVMDLIFYAMSFYSVDFIYNHVPLIGTWNREQLLFFIAFMLCIDNIHMIVVSENFWEFTRLVRTGEMDFLLLRPLSSMFSVFFSYFRTASLVTLPVSQGLLFYYAYKLHFPWYNYFLLPVLLVTSFILLISMEIMLSVATFWLTEGYGINFLRMQFQKMARWPQFIYQGVWKLIFLWVFPVLMIGSAPSSILYGEKPLFWASSLVGASFLFMFLTNKVWLWGVKHYESASS